jgi:hypothetical protein
MSLGMRRFALYSAGLKLLCNPKTKPMTSKVAKKVGDGGKKKDMKKIAVFGLW